MTQEPMQKIEEKVLREEKKIEREIKRAEVELKLVRRNVLMVAAGIVLVLGGGIAGLAYWKVSSGQVYIEKSQVLAPQINLAPQSGGILEEMFVREGDQIGPNTVVARVGNELVSSKVGGIITMADHDLGALVAPGQTVVQMYDPSELRVVGSLDEDKGLSDVRVGAPAVFTVDAFGGKRYYGVVDEVSPSAKQGDVVFNISDQRQTQQFDVKVRFDVSAYPELKNGMSAKIWVYK
ncbi:MAG: efflux RND transporter periplasmic adaptor subunit [Patescibacteria group bacterium]|nr:efflux RND transporter periplasmic adaptor subunit [Patescibacteria group bacterium]